MTVGWRILAVSLAAAWAAPALAAPVDAKAAPVAPGGKPAQAAGPTAAKTIAKPAAAAPAPAATPIVDLAYGAYQRGLYRTAFREATFRLERDGTDASAMTLLAEIYNLGLAVRLDPVQAAQWYRLAAARGDAHAMASLGLMAADGRGMARDPAVARAWFEKAAAEGEPTAAYNMALLLLASGNKAEIGRAAAYLKIAADGELADAQHDLGVLYARGEGVPRDPAEAARLYLKAVKGGSIAGEVEYAIALANGDGVPKDETMAARIFRRAAARGNAIAQNRLARLYATGRGVQRNLVEAAAWHLVASGQGLPDAWLDGAVKDMPTPDKTRAEQLATERAGIL